MNKPWIILLFVPFIYAGSFVFHTGETITGKRTSCGAVCSSRPDALRIDEETFESITSFHKVVADEVVEMSQSEKDVILQADADALALAEVNRLITIDDNLADTSASDEGIKLTRIETEIDNIGSYNDLKKVLKRVVRYMSAK